MDYLELKQPKLQSNEYFGMNGTSAAHFICVSEKD